MATRLGEMLEQRREDLREGIAEAERELAGCRQRCEEIEATIHQARAAIGVAVEPTNRPLTDEERAWGEDLLNTMTHGRPLYLQEAMVEVLRGSDNGVMRAPAIAKAINDQRLYRQRDGGPVSVQQIHARVYHYPELFGRTGSGIRLKDF